MGDTAQLSGAELHVHSTISCQKENHRSGLNLWDVPKYGNSRLDGGVLAPFIPYGFLERPPSCLKISGNSAVAGLLRSFPRREKL